MDIIKEAVLRIEQASSGARAIESPDPSDLARHVDFDDTEMPRSAEEPAALRIYHSAMRDERVHTAFTDLRTHAIQRIGKRSCSIVVSSLVRGGGASFVATNLAAAFASDSSSVAVLADCNFAGSRYTELGDDSSKRGITDYIDGTKSTIAELMMDVGIPRLRLLGGGTLRGTQREYFTRPRAQTMFAELAQLNDCAVVVDAPPALLSANASVIARYCDAVLLVVPYGTTTQHDVRAAMRSMPAEKLLGSVFNNVPHWRVP